MKVRSLRLPYLAVAVAALCVRAAAPVSAQQQQQQSAELQSWHMPGWTFTPGVIFGGMYDSNVALVGPGDLQSRPGDKLFQVEPFGQVEYFSPRTRLSAGYHGFMQRYLDLDELDSTDHRAFMSLRQRVSRRVTLFASENFAQSPTTDRLELNGVPFQRSGARYNDVAGGVEARLTKSTDLTARYETTWVDFVRKDTATLLTGGTVNGVRTSLSHRFDARLALGGEYQFRWADLNGGTRQQFFHNTGAVFQYRSSDDTTFEAAGGISHLDDRTRGVTRTGPYVRAELTHRAQRATVGARFLRSYVPSVAFGGTNHNEEAQAYVQMPLNHNRLYVQESATWHRSNPLDTTELPLQSIWLHNVLGYAVQRWFRIEGYYSFTHQDTRVAGGQITRHVTGVQFVVSEPMRIR
jgi:hypothetical protein